MNATILNSQKVIIEMDFYEFKLLQSTMEQIDESNYSNNYETVKDFDLLIRSLENSNADKYQLAQANKAYRALSEFCLMVSSQNFVVNKFLDVSNPLTHKIADIEVKRNNS